MTKKKILVVEDEGIVARDIQNRLKTLGYDVPEIASTGDIALQKAEQINPDLILMDIMLKGEMTGIEAAAAIRKQKNIPVIYLTAYSDEATLERAKITEPHGYILKPFEERELHTAVEIALHKHKIEQKLRESEKWLKTTLSSIGDGVISTDGSGKIMFLNPAAEVLTGWTQDDAIGKDFKEVFNIVNENKEQFSDSPLPRVLRGEGVVIGLANHTVLISKDGTQRPIEDSAAPIRDDEGNIVGVVLVFKDISERRLAESKLRDSEERFRLLAETAKDAIITVDDNNCIQFVNKSTERTFGYETEALLGQSISKIMPERLRDRHLNAFNNYKKTGRKTLNWMATELVGLHKSGHEFPIEISFGEYRKNSERLFTGIIRDISERKEAEKKINVLAKFPEDNPNPILRIDADGMLLYANKASSSLLKEWDIEINQTVPPHLYQSILTVLETQESENILLKIDKTLYNFIIVSYPDIKSVYLYGQDITRQKHAEDELAAEKELLATTLRSIGDGVVTTNIEGEIVFINTVAERLTGWSQKEAVGKPLDEVFHTIHEKTRNRCENPVHLVLRSRKIIELPSKIILIARDGTERLIADSAAPICDGDSNVIGVVLVFQDITERIKLELELSKSQKLESIGVLAGGIAHDFNNILTGILGNISLLKLNTNPDDRQYKRITEAEKASLRAKDLTQRLLTFAKGGAPIKVATSIMDIIVDTTNFALAGSNVECQFDSPQKDLWSTEVDPGQFSQVINNLIINADQAMPDGGSIVIRLENFAHESPKIPNLRQGNYVKISISDQGIGIPNENLVKIFDPYFTTKEKGSGLGLAICYSIVKNHVGTIQVESQEDIGTTFNIYLPASSKQTTLAHEDDKSQLALSVGKGTILVMDDEDIVRDVVAEMLPKLGYEFKVVKNGAEAIDSYVQAMKSNKPFDVVIMDLTIPGGMGGKEAIKRLAAIDHNVKAIVSSGYSNDPIMANYRNYGFCNMLVKPFQIQELAEILQDVIGEVSETAN